MYASAYFIKAASLIPYGKLLGMPPSECMLIVDSGFSFTHVVPMINNIISWPAVKRLYTSGHWLWDVIVNCSQTGRRRKTTHKPIEGIDIFSSVEYDGRNIHREPR